LVNDNKDRMRRRARRQWGGEVIVRGDVRSLFLKKVVPDGKHKLVSRPGGGKKSR